MDIKNISDDLMEKAKNATTPEEILALAQEEGYELTDEQLEQVSGGGFWSVNDAYSDGCPKCKSHNLKFGNIGHIMWYTCKDCGYEWC